MKILYIKRETQYEKRYSIKMGALIIKVTYIKKYLLGLPVHTVKKHKETYYDEVKTTNDHMLFV